MVLADLGDKAGSLPTALYALPRFPHCMVQAGCTPAAGPLHVPLSELSFLYTLRAPPLIR